MITPATNQPFLGLCFTDGLAYNENNSASDVDDEIWFSDDVNRNIGVFRPNGTFVAGADATIVDASLSDTSGLAIGGANLYLANNGGGDVFRATTVAGLTLVDQFVSDLQNGDLKVHMDFRRIYATILDDWLGLDADQLLREPFQCLPLFDA